MFSEKCTVPTLPNIAKLSGGELKHLGTITGIVCNSGYVTSGGRKLTCNDGTLTYSTPNAARTSCHGKLPEVYLDN